MVMILPALMDAHRVRQFPLNNILLVFSLYVRKYHYSDVIMSAMASQINGVSIVCSAVC